MLPMRIAQRRPWPRMRSLLDSPACNPHAPRMPKPPAPNIDKPMPVAGMVEDIVGCKWSLVVLQMIGNGVVRPGAMQRQVDGLTAKVLNERLRKLMRFGIVEREVFAEVPPRVEYRLSEFGLRFRKLLDHIDELERERG
jgi:DNA-binding HxlR family transcriptional regulator